MNGQAQEKGPPAGVLAQFVNHASLAFKRQRPRLDRTRIGYYG